MFCGDFGGGFNPSRTSFGLTSAFSLLGSKADGLWFLKSTVPGCTQGTEVPWGCAPRSRYTWRCRILSRLAVCFGFRVGGNRGQSVASTRASETDARVPDGPPIDRELENQRPAPTPPTYPEVVIREAGLRLPPCRLLGDLPSSHRPPVITSRAVRSACSRFGYRTFLSGPVRMLGRSPAICRQGSSIAGMLLVPINLSWVRPPEVREHV